MAEVTDQAILTAVNEAILAIVTGKTASAGYASQQLTMLSIGELQKMKREYEMRITAANPSSPGGTALVEYGEPQ